MPSPGENDKKVEQAFELVDRLEKKDVLPKPVSVKEKPEEGQWAGPPGIRIQFKMDALFPREKSFRKNSAESELFDFRFTIPHVWQVPVLGNLALKAAKHLQAKKVPETIRDIFKYLKNS
jgi:hypothetical protein